MDYTSSAQTGKRHWKTRLLYLGVTTIVGIFTYLHVLPFVFHTAWAVSLKAAGQTEICTWPRVLTFYTNIARFNSLLGEKVRSQYAVVEEDERLPLQRISMENGTLWVRKEESSGPGIEYLVAEHDWIAELNPDETVGPGEIVLDVGAHVGIFVVKALKLGAAKVVAIEPDPLNVECLRRNFASEIAQGRVVVVPVGAWNEEGVMTLHIGDSSGWNSMVDPQGAGSIEVPVRRIDEIVRDAKLSGVDYIKMDIEGAEKEAIEGASGTLKRYHPRLMIDTHPWAGRLEVLHRAIEQPGTVYVAVCGPCQPAQDLPQSHLVPHVTFYR